MRERSEGKELIGLVRAGFVRIGSGRVRLWWALRFESLERGDQELDAAVPVAEHHDEEEELDQAHDLIDGPAGGRQRKARSTTRTMQTRPDHPSGLTGRRLHGSTVTRVDSGRRLRQSR